jgi:hypothetical protein
MIQTSSEKLKITSRNNGYMRVKWPGREAEHSPHLIPRSKNEWSHTSILPILDGSEWSASRPGRFTPRRKSPWYPMDRRLGGLQSRSGRGIEEKNFQPLTGLELPITQPVIQCYTTELSPGPVLSFKLSTTS